MIKINCELLNKKIKNLENVAFLSIQIYYLALFLFILENSIKFWLRPGIDLTVLKTPLWPLFWIDETSLGTIVPPIYASTVLLTFICCFFPERRPFRILSTVGLLLCVALQFPFGEIYHESHGWILTSMVLAICGVNRLNSQVGKEINSHTLFACQITLSSIYLFSGLGKILGGAIFYQDSPIGFIMSRWIKVGIEPGPTARALMEFPTLLYIGFIFLTLCQIFQVLFLFRKDTYLIHGLFFVFFHICNYLVVGAIYSGAMQCAIIVFIVPWLIKRSLHLRSDLKMSGDKHSAN